MKKLFLLALVVVIGAVGRTAPVETGALSLSELFKPGVVFQDRNGDGAIDFVDVRLVLSEQPSAGELAAASDIAARLGYETSAMNLPIPRVGGARTVQAVDGARAFQASETGATIFVGAKSLARADVTAESIGAAGLK